MKSCKVKNIVALLSFIYLSGANSQEWNFESPDLISQGEIHLDLGGDGSIKINSKEGLSTSNVVIASGGAELGQVVKSVYPFDLFISEFDLDVNDWKSLGDKDEDDNVDITGTALAEKIGKDLVQFKTDFVTGLVVADTINTKTTYKNGRHYVQFINSKGESLNGEGVAVGSDGSKISISNYLSEHATCKKTMDESWYSNTTSRTWYTYNNPSCSNIYGQTSTTIEFRSTSRYNLKYSLVDENLCTFQVYWENGSTYSSRYTGCRSINSSSSGAGTLGDANGTTRVDVIMPADKVQSAEQQIYEYLRVN